MTLYLLSVGFISMLAQVVALRELNVAFFGVELIYVLAISVWLLSTAVGALVGGTQRKVTPEDVARPLLSSALLIPAEIVLVRSLRTVSGGIPGTFLPFGVQIAGLAAAVVPVGIVLGVLFRRAAALYVSDGGQPGSRGTSRSARTLARAYAIESAGGLAGGLASTLLLAAGLQNLAGVVVCGGVALVTVLFARGTRAGSRTRTVAIVGAVLYSAFAASSPRIDRALTKLSHPGLLASRDSPYGRVTITSQRGQFVVYENDALSFETQSVSSEELVHLAAVNVDTLERVLVLGGGLEGTASEVAKYGPPRVDVVELNPVLVSLAQTRLPIGYRESLALDGVFLHVADPRRFVTRTEERYDLVLLGAADPASGQANRFFTREFFSLCEKAVSPGGVVAFRLKSSENVWTPFLSYRNTSIVKALGEVFADVVVLPGTTNLVIASNRSLSRDPVLLGAKLRTSGVATRLVTPEYIGHLYTNDRFGDIERRLSETAVAPNTDARPVCYRYSTLIWLSKFSPRLITADPGSPDLASGRGALILVVLIVPVGAAVVFVRRPRFRRIALAVLAGFIGMVLETVMILHYQVVNGVLYQNLGILLTAFMAGLAVGAEAAPRLARDPGGSPFRPRRLTGVSLVGGLSLLAVGFVWVLRAGGPTGLWTASFLLLLCGFLVAGVFAFATLIGPARSGDQSTMIGPLYAADLLGGCAGSVLGCMFLIPFAGMEQTAGVAFLVSLLALLAV